MKTVIRTQKISIDKPSMMEEAWVNCILQTVQLGADSEVVSVSGRVEQMHRKGSSVAFEVVSFTNPITGEIKELSGLEMQLAIGAFSRKWIIEDMNNSGRPTTIDNDDNVVLEDT